MFKTIIIKATVFGLIILLMGSGVVSAMLTTNNQVNNQKNAGYTSYPTYGSIAVYWGQLGIKYEYTRGLTIGIPENRNYSFPVQNGYVKLGFIVNCYMSTLRRFIASPRFALFISEIRNHDGVLKGRKIILHSIQTLSMEEFNMTLVSSSIQAVSNSSGNFTITLIGIAFEPKFTFNLVTEPIWVHYT